MEPVVNANGNGDSGNARNTRCTGTHSTRRLQADLYIQAQHALNAIRLIELGARAGLVRHLTGLDKKATNHLYRQLQGRPSPSGQMPFTDAWFRKHWQRMLHAALVWKFDQHFRSLEVEPAALLICVYESYLQFVDRPVLDLTRAFQVPQLVTANTWREQGCHECGTIFLTPTARPQETCPGCERYARYRCKRCGQAIVTLGKGRPRACCEQCRAR